MVYLNQNVLTIVIAIKQKIEVLKEVGITVEIRSKHAKIFKKEKRTHKTKILSG